MVREKGLLEYGAGQFADGTSENRQPSRAAMQISSPSRDFRAANELLMHPQHLGNGFGGLADVGFGVRSLRFFMVARMPRGVDQRYTARLFPIVVMPCAFSLSAGEWRGTGTRMT